MKTLAEVNKKNKNLGLPFRSEEKSPLFLSAKASGSPFNFGGSMAEHFTVIQKDKQFLVRYNPGKVDVAIYPSYLRAKFYAYMKNRILKTSKQELNMGVR